MKLTTQELEQMRSVDIGAVAAESLPDVSGMTFDNALSRKERISRFLQTVKNPYCFCIGGVGVKQLVLLLRDKVSRSGGILVVLPGQSYNISVM